MIVRGLEVAVAAPRALDHRAAALREEIGRRARGGAPAPTAWPSESVKRRSRVLGIPLERAGLDHAAQAIGLARDRRGAQLGRA